MRKCYLLFLTVSFCLVLCACKEGKRTKQSSSKVTLNLDITHLTSDTVSILVFDMLTGKSNTLSEVILDSSGRGEMKMDLEHGLFAVLDYQPVKEEQIKNIQLYLEPGDSISVSLDGEAPNQSIQFEGKGAKVNNYLTQAFLVRKPFFKSGGKFIWELETDSFLSRLDSIRDSMDTFLQQYADSVHMASDIRRLMEKRNRIDILKEKVGYVFLMQNNFVVKAMINGKKVGKFQLPEVFSNIYDEIPYDSGLMEKQLADYAFVLQKSVDASVIYPFYFGKSREDIEALNEQMPLIVDSIIRASYDQVKFPDYYLAWNINSWMSRQGLSPHVDSLYHKFLRNNSNSAYLDPLREVYQSWMAISPGSLAPDFYGTTPEGKRLALSDLKGKIVYIDVWATWCKPCREEFPASKKLSKEFADNEEVAFLYVSLDKDHSAWMKFLQKNPSLKGIHMLDTAPEEESIWKKYLLAGVPSYILIDQEGRIKDPEADWPSSGKVARQIHALLN